jgi:hypothetical protein
VYADKQHVAERFDVTAAVQTDGSLEVVERIAFRFTGGSFTRVSRELTSRESDGVEVLSAAMDGREMPRGDADGQVEIDRGGTRILWHFAPAENEVHVFTLRYRYAGVVRYGEGEDWFRWPPYPSDFDYPIEAGTVRLTWPAFARPRRAPDVEGSVSATSPIENGIAIDVANYRKRDDDVRLTLRFEPGAFPGQEPQWQRDARRADRLAPAFLAAALMIAAATGLALWLFFLRYRRGPRQTPLPPGSVTHPPDDLPAALGGSIVGGAGVAGAHVLAAAFELARRGVLKIEERPASGRFGKPAFVFQRGSDASVRPHEQAVMAAIFKGSEREAPFTRGLRRAVGSRAIGKAMKAELAAAGYIDKDRKEGGRALLISGLVVIGFSMALMIVAAGASRRLGEAALLVPLAFGLAGITLAITGASFSKLSASGAAAARRWSAYRLHLKNEMKQGRVPADGEAIGRMLPYAAALGLLAPFGKALEKTAVHNLPPWLRTLDAAGGHAAMIAMLTAGSSSTHGGHGGGGAGGVGAGGSSSAG